MLSNFEVFIRKKCNHGTYLDDNKVEGLPDKINYESVKKTVEATVNIILGCAAKSKKKELKKKIYGHINFKAIDRVAKGKSALLILKETLQCCNNFLGNRKPKHQSCPKCREKDTENTQTTESKDCIESTTEPVFNENQHLQFPSPAVLLQGNSAVDIDNNTITEEKPTRTKHTAEIFFRKNCKAGGLLDPLKVEELPLCLKSTNIPSLSKLILETIVKCASDPEQVFTCIPYGRGSVVVEAQIGTDIQRRSFPTTHSKKELKKLLKQFADAIGMCPNFITMQEPSKMRCNVCKSIRRFPVVTKMNSKEDLLRAEPLSGKRSYSECEDVVPPAKKQKTSEQVESIVCMDLRVVIKRLPEAVVKKYLKPAAQMKKEAYFRGQKITVVIPESKYHHSPRKVLFPSINQFPSPLKGLDLDADNPLNNLEMSPPFEHETEQSVDTVDSENFDPDRFINSYSKSPRPEMSIDNSSNCAEKIVVDGPLSVLFEKESNPIGLSSGMVNDDVFSETAEECERDLTLFSPKSFFGDIDLNDHQGNQEQHSEISASSEAKTPDKRIKIKQENTETEEAKDSSDTTNNNLSSDVEEGRIASDEPPKLQYMGGAKTSNSLQLSHLIEEVATKHTMHYSGTGDIHPVASTHSQVSTPEIPVYSRQFEGQLPGQESTVPGQSTSQVKVSGMSAQPFETQPQLSRPSLEHAQESMLPSNTENFQTRTGLPGNLSQAQSQSTRPSAQVQKSMPNEVANLSWNCPGNYAGSASPGAARHLQEVAQSRLPLAVPGTSIVIPPSNALSCQSVSRSPLLQSKQNSQHEIPGRMIAGFPPHQHHSLPTSSYASRFENIVNNFETPPTPFTTSNYTGYTPNMFPRQVLSPTERRETPLAVLQQTANYRDLFHTQPSRSVPPVVPHQTPYAMNQMYQENRLIQQDNPILSSVLNDSDIIQPRNDLSFLKTYINVNRHYLVFCTARSVNPDPVSEEKVAMYITFLSESLKQDSVANYVHLVRKVLTRQHSLESRQNLQPTNQADKRVCQQYYNFCSTRNINPIPISQEKLTMFTTFITERLIPEKVAPYLSLVRSMLISRDFWLVSTEESFSSTLMPELYNVNTVRQPARLEDLRRFTALVNNMYRDGNQILPGHVYQNQVHVMMENLARQQQESSGRHAATQRNSNSCRRSSVEKESLEKQSLSSTERQLAQQTLPVSHQSESHVSYTSASSPNFGVSAGGALGTQLYPGVTKTVPGSIPQIRNAYPSSAQHSDFSSHHLLKSSTVQKTLEKVTSTSRPVNVVPPQQTYSANVISSRTVPLSEPCLLEKSDQRGSHQSDGEINQSELLAKEMSAENSPVVNQADQQMTRNLQRSSSTEMSTSTQSLQSTLQASESLQGEYASSTTLRTSTSDPPPEKSSQNTLQRNDKCVRNDNESRSAGQSTDQASSRMSKSDSTPESSSQNTLQSNDNNKTQSSTVRSTNRGTKRSNCSDEEPSSSKRLAVNSPEASNQGQGSTESPRSLVEEESMDIFSNSPPRHTSGADVTKSSNTKVEHSDSCDPDSTRQKSEESSNTFSAISAQVGHKSSKFDTSSNLVKERSPSSPSSSVSVSRDTLSQCSQQLVHSKTPATSLQTSTSSVFKSGLKRSRLARKSSASKKIKNSQNEKHSETSLSVKSSNTSQHHKASSGETFPPKDDNSISVKEVPSDSSSAKDSSPYELMVKNLNMIRQATIKSKNDTESITSTITPVEKSYTDSESANILSSPKSNSAQLAQHGMNTPSNDASNSSTTSTNMPITVAQKGTKYSNTNVSSSSLSSKDTPSTLVQKNFKSSNSKDSKSSKSSISKSPMEQKYTNSSNCSLSSSDTLSSSNASKTAATSTDECPTTIDATQNSIRNSDRNSAITSPSPKKGDCEPVIPDDPTQTAQIITPRSSKAVRTKSNSLDGSCARSRGSPPSKKDKNNTSARGPALPSSSKRSDSKEDTSTSIPVVDLTIGIIPQAQLSKESHEKSEGTFVSKVKPIESKTSTKEKLACKDSSSNLHALLSVLGECEPESKERVKKMLTALLKKFKLNDVILKSEIAELRTAVGPVVEKGQSFGKVLAVLLPRTESEEHQKPTSSSKSSSNEIVSITIAEDYDSSNAQSIDSRHLEKDRSEVSCSSNSDPNSSDKANVKESDHSEGVKSTQDPILSNSSSSSSSKANRKDSKADASKEASIENSEKIQTTKALNSPAQQMNPTVEETKQSTTQPTPKCHSSDTINTESNQIDTPNTTGSNSSPKASGKASSLKDSVQTPKSDANSMKDSTVDCSLTDTSTNKATPKSIKDSRKAASKDVTYNSSSLPLTSPKATCIDVEDRGCTTTNQSNTSKSESTTITTLSSDTSKTSSSKYESSAVQKSSSDGKDSTSLAMASLQTAESCLALGDSSLNLSTKNQSTPSKKSGRTARKSSARVTKPPKVTLNQLTPDNSFLKTNTNETSPLISISASKETANEEPMDTSSDISKGDKTSMASTFVLHNNSADNAKTDITTAPESIADKVGTYSTSPKDVPMDSSGVPTVSLTSSLQSSSETDKCSQEENSTCDATLSSNLSKISNSNETSQTTIPTKASQGSRDNSSDLPPKIKTTNISECNNDTAVTSGTDTDDIQSLPTQESMALTSQCLISPKVMPSSFTVLCDTLSPTISLAKSLNNKQTDETENQQEDNQINAKPKQVQLEMKGAEDNEKNHTLTQSSTESRETEDRSEDNNKAEQNVLETVPDDNQQIVKVHENAQETEHREGMTSSTNSNLLDISTEYPVDKDCLGTVLDEGDQSGKDGTTGIADESKGKSCIDGSANSSGGSTLSKINSDHRSNNQTSTSGSAITSAQSHPSDCFLSSKVGTRYDTHSAAENSDVLLSSPHSSDIEPSSTRACISGTSRTSEGQGGLASYTLNVQSTAGPSSASVASTSSTSQLGSNRFNNKFMEKIKQYNKKDQASFNSVLKEILYKLKNEGSISVLDLLRLRKAAPKTFRKTTEFKMLLEMFNVNPSSGASNEIIDLTTSDSDEEEIAKDHKDASSSNEATMSGIVSQETATAVRDSVDTATSESNNQSLNQDYLSQSDVVMQAASENSCSGINMEDVTVTTEENTSPVSETTQTSDWDIFKKLQITPEPMDESPSTPDIHVASNTATNSTIASSSDSVTQARVKPLDTIVGTSDMSKRQVIFDKGNDFTKTSSNTLSSAAIPAISQMDISCPIIISAVSLNTANQGAKNPLSAVPPSIVSSPINTLPSRQAVLCVSQLNNQSPIPTPTRVTTNMIPLTQSSAVNGRSFIPIVPPKTIDSSMSNRTGTFQTRINPLTNTTAVHPHLPQTMARTPTVLAPSHRETDRTMSPLSTDTHNRLPSGLVAVAQPTISDVRHPTGGNGPARGQPVVTPIRTQIGLNGPQSTVTPLGPHQGHTASTPLHSAVTQKQNYSSPAIPQLTATPHRPHQGHTASTPVHSAIPQLAFCAPAIHQSAVTPHRPLQGHTASTPVHSTVTQKQNYSSPVIPQSVVISQHPHQGHTASTPLHSTVTQQQNYSSPVIPQSVVISQHPHQVHTASTPLHSTVTQQQNYSSTAILQTPHRPLQGHAVTIPVHPAVHQQAFGGTAIHQSAVTPHGALQGHNGSTSVPSAATQQGYSRPIISQSAVTPSRLLAGIERPAQDQLASVTNSAVGTLVRTVVSRSAVTHSNQSTVTPNRTVNHVPAISNSVVMPNRTTVNMSGVSQSTVSPNTTTTFNPGRSNIHVQAVSKSEVSNSSQKNFSPTIPRPVVSVISVNDSTILMWDLLDRSTVQSIACYEIYAIQLQSHETISTEVIRSKPWAPLGVVKSLPPPMCITLTNLCDGLKSYIIVRAVDHQRRVGRFSAICEVKATKIEDE